jgi:hypothetical protein
VFAVNRGFSELPEKLEPESRRCRLGQAKGAAGPAERGGGGGNLAEIEVNLEICQLTCNKLNVHCYAV